MKKGKKVLLKGKQISKYFGGLAAVKDVDFIIKEKEIVGLIGPNGAGKTTLFNVISGIYNPTSGKVEFNGIDISKFKPNKICNLGIGRTFQIMKPFLNITTLKNVMIGVLFGKGKSIKMKDARNKAAYFLEFVGLLDKKDYLAKSLTHADRKMLEIARALATEPKLILLDEVVAGLNPTETKQAMKLIKKIRDKLNITVFWVEHVMKAVMGVAERVIVLHHGEKIADGTPKSVAKNKEVIDAYLGEKYLF
jgi:branched-chain amino acid transport system ATP-binding protein